jgi:hypothetical protein
MSNVTKRKKLGGSTGAVANDVRLYPFRLWRMIPAEEFDLFCKIAVSAYIAEFAIGDVAWRRAIAGDATCAIRIALRMEVPDEVTYPVDARMTLLAYSALNGSAAAALVLAHLLRKMPLDGPHKNRLATSWLVRNLRLARPEITAPHRRRSYARRSIAAQLLGKPECES